ncbi:MAG: dimethylsulfonioproprionate lyase family protein, partial [Paracoccaceae bacterium]
GTDRAEVGAALGAIASDLRWTRRSSADPSEPIFWNGHANALIMGQGGLEERDDLWIGVTLMAPDITYVDHDHPPEEVYLSLSPGEWWNADMDWTDPGMTGLIYNPPGIRHAMRSGAKPFLALWFLPL